MGGAGEQLEVTEMTKNMVRRQVIGSRGFLTFSHEVETEYCEECLASSECGAKAVRGKNKTKILATISISCV